MMWLFQQEYGPIQASALGQLSEGNGRLSGWSRQLDYRLDLQYTTWKELRVKLVKYNKLNKNLQQNGVFLVSLISK